MNELAESEIEREPSLLSRDRGKAATLIQGAVERSTVYKHPEASFDALLAEHLHHVEAAAREIRKAEIGEEAATEEERLGSKTDEEYAAQSTIRREAREKIRKYEEAKKRREEEKERLIAEEKAKKAELDKLRKANERRKEHEAREAKRKADREAQRAIQKQEEEKREAERRERHEQRKQEELERYRTENPPRIQSRQRSASAARSETPRKTHAKSPTPGIVPEVDEKALEEAALELLIKEGRELAAKSIPQRADLESLDLPQPRKPTSKSSTITPIQRNSPVPKPKIETVPETSTRICGRSMSREPYTTRPRSRSRDRHPSRRHDIEPPQYPPKSSSPIQTRISELHKRARSRTRSPHLPSRQQRSRSRSAPRRDRDRRDSYTSSRPHYRDERRDDRKNNHRTDRSRTRDRDRSRDRRTSTRHPRSRSRSRTKRREYEGRRVENAKDIDRYVPSGGRRDERKDERRDDRREEGRRDDRRDGGDRRDEGRRDRDRDDRREREKKYVEIDRYVPGGGGAGDEKRERREREKSGSRGR